MSQRAQVLAWLRKGRTITHLEAERLFGCIRVAARIDELRNAGWPIVTDMIQVRTKAGKARVACYRLEAMQGKERLEMNTVLG